jgi:RNA polymerase sigma factor (sigma-70 family)
VTPQAHPLARFLHHFATAGAALPDAQLLGRFVDHRDEDAFATLVRRHGPMVLAVCRRVLGEGDWQAAEDAFQATFLVLAHKSAALRRPQSLGPWLHGVAHRTALKARSNSIRRRICEQRACRQRPEACFPSDPMWCDLRPVLDDAIGRLPHRYRAPFVLCCLEGRTVTQAAEDLGWPRGTVATRLARARERLRRKLTRLGLALGTAGFALAITESGAQAALSVPLARLTASAAVQFMDDTTRAITTGSVPAGVATLTREVLRVMTMNRIRIAALGIVIVAMLAAGLGAVALWPTAATAQDLQPPPAASKSEATQGRANAGKSDKLQLPQTEPPQQALAILDKDGKLRTRVSTTVYTPVTSVNDQGNTVTGYRPERKVVELEHDANKVQAYNTHGEKIEARMLAKMLTKESLVLITAEFDPLHLRVLKEGTVILVTPAVPVFVPPLAVPSVQVPPMKGAPIPDRHP